MLGLMSTTWFLSMWMSNTTTTAMMIPMANAILLQLKETARNLKDGMLLNEPPRDKTNKMACSPSGDSNQPGHPPSLIRVFAVRSMGSQGPGPG